MRSIAFVGNSAESKQSAFHAALLSSEFYHVTLRELDADAYWSELSLPLYGLYRRDDPLGELGSAMHVLSRELEPAFKSSKYGQFLKGELQGEFDLLWKKYEKDWDFVDDFPHIESSRALLDEAALLTQATLVCRARPISCSSGLAHCLDTIMFWNCLFNRKLAKASRGLNLACQPPFLVSLPRFGFETAEEVHDLQSRLTDELSHFVQTLNNQSIVTERDMKSAALVDAFISESRRLQLAANGIFKAVKRKLADRDKMTTMLINRSLLPPQDSDCVLATRVGLPVGYLVSCAPVVAAMIDMRVLDYCSQREIRLPGSALLMDFSNGGYRLWPRVRQFLSNRPVD